MSALLVHLVFVVTVEVSRAEIFSAVVRVREAPLLELKLLNIFEKFLIVHNDSLPSEKLGAATRFLDRTKRRNRKILEDSALIENPINVFHLFKRLLRNWDDIIQDVTCRSCGIQDPDEIQTVVSGVFWPKEEDLQGTAIGLCRLLDVYKLNLLDIQNGKIRDSPKAPSMTFSDLLYIGTTCLNADLNKEAEFWFAQLLELPGTTREEHFSDISIATKKYATALYLNGNLGQAIEVLQTRLSKDPSNKELLLELSFYMTQESKIDSSKTNQLNLEYEYVNDLYEKLCREDVEISNESMNLLCFIKTTRIPFHTIRVEILNENPKIWIFHDVISSREAEWLKQKATENISRSLLGSFNGTGLGASESRISQQAWVFDNHLVSLRISQRIALYTGLDVATKPISTNAEPFQVLNYGIGGLYGTHVDSVRRYRDMGYENGDMLRHSGDRLATWMFYLSDVKYGGATVFPILKIRVPVTKGSAAFWYNLKRNGQIDYRTAHAGCPVVVGDKWIANKWIREAGQTFSHPCTLDENE